MKNDNKREIIRGKGEFGKIVVNKEKKVYGGGSTHQIQEKGTKWERNMNEI